MKKIASKTLYSLLTIFLAISAIFFVMRLAPGDPVMRILGPEASLEEIEKYRTQLGLNLPVIKQYLNYLSGIMQGDLGLSLFKRKPVLSLLKIHLPATIFLAMSSLTISTFIGIAGGVISAAKKSTRIDNTIRIISLITLSFPIFSLAPVLVYLFAIKLNMLPVSEWGEIKHSILPILTLVLPLSSIIIRVTRNRVLEEKNSPWVQVLEAKGLNPFQILIRITKACLPTILNVVAIQLSVVLAGTMITETIFDIPGMGMLLFEGIQNRDYPIVQGVIIYTTIIYMLVYFLVDFANSKIDPRIE